jgi:UDP-N-acetylmuramate: L-alanyl-gamma-D-glutamyl-meso-diaminopimelate ligase
MSAQPTSVHFIAIGGAAMHNLALALHQLGFRVTGSDDEINEPSRSRLQAAGLLPKAIGWFPERLNSRPDAVILGMHAREDNPELQRARELGLKVYSYPEYLYEHSRNKTRVVIGGSHGKTTITAMVLWVLRSLGRDFDYLVGAKLEGFETMVRISDAPLIVLEGDEYLASPVDRRPKFHLYHAHIALLSGIAWDHINVFPTYGQYLEQFRIYVEQVPAVGQVIYCKEDPEVVRLMDSAQVQALPVPYGVPPHRIEGGRTILETSAGDVPIAVFGKHNLMNLEGARLVCRALGVTDEQFYPAIANFRGAARRLEFLAGNNQLAVYKDFAHSPSKLKATTEAVRQQFPERRLIAVMELHTFSSLNEKFLDEYKGSMAAADEAWVYFNPHTIEHKRLPAISPDRVAKAFDRPDLQVFIDSRLWLDRLRAQDLRGTVVLFMSSGTFDGIVLEDIARELTEKSLLPSA